MAAVLTKQLTPTHYAGAEGASIRLSQLIRDFLVSVKRSGFWLYSSWMEVLLSYRSTILGPIWIVMGTAVFVFAVGMLYSHVILANGSNVYLAHLAVGITLWYLISKVLIGSCHFFRSNRSYILDGDINYTDLILKLITTNLIYLTHNSIIVVIALIVSGSFVSLVAGLIFLTFPLVLLNLTWISVTLAILGARFPDLEEFTQSSLRLLFFLTPILWVANQHVRGAVVDALLYLNPFYYFIEVIGGPLVYGHIPYFEIAILTVALPIGWLIASFLYARTRPWLALWL